MEFSSINPSFGVVASSGSTLTGATSTETSETSLVHQPLSSSFHVERSAAHDISMQTVRKPSSYEFAEQIRQLEIEGSKLRSATVSALAQGECEMLEIETRLDMFTFHARAKASIQLMIILKF